MKTPATLSQVKRRSWIGCGILVAVTGIAIVTWKRKTNDEPSVPARSGISQAFAKVREARFNRMAKKDAHQRPAPAPSYESWTRYASLK